MKIVMIEEGDLVLSRLALRGSWDPSPWMLLAFVLGMLVARAFYFTMVGS